MSVCPAGIRVSCWHLYVILVSVCPAARGGSGRLYREPPRAVLPRGPSETVGEKCLLRKKRSSVLVGEAGTAQQLAEDSISILFPSQAPPVPAVPAAVMENSSVASASSEAGSSRSQEIEELERFIDSYVLEYQVQGLLTDKTEGDGESEKTQSNISQVGGLRGAAGLGDAREAFQAQKRSEMMGLGQLGTPQLCLYLS